MGMVCTLQRVKAGDVAELLASPDTALARIANSDVSYPVEEVRLGGFIGFLLRLTPIKVTQVADRPGSDARSVLPPEPGRMEVEVWDVLNYLLSGSATEGELPAGFLVNGGAQLVTEDDETHLRLLTPQEMGDIHHHLQTLSLDDLRARIDIPQMLKEGVISRPRGSDKPAMSAEYLENVLAEFEALRNFVGATKAQSDGLLVLIN
jgi:hypothetical protein